MGNMKRVNYALEMFRESLCWWFLLIGSIIWEWTNDYLYSPECFSERFFDAMEPRWEYREKSDDAPDSDDFDGDDIPF
jgi:hypothetical protein